jgi:hypothetical protein
LGRNFENTTCGREQEDRAELGRYNAFLVRLSDDCDSDFKVEPIENSIKSCLNNVEQADVVVCIIDRRYGPSSPNPATD